MSKIQLTLICLILCSGINAFSQKHTDMKLLLGEKLEKARFEDGSWKLDNGILTGLEDKVLWATGTFENFILELEFRNEAGTNSGVIVYCTDENNWIPNSVEIQIADDYSEKWGDARKDFQCGAIFGHLPANEQQIVKEPGEWNTLQIRCKGQHINVVLNGKNVTHMDMGLWKSGKTNPDGSEIPAWLPTPFSELPTKGSIGFQGKHGDAKISFKDIFIQEL